MKTYNVHLSDRRRVRHIKAESAQDAVAIAVGKRLLFCNVDGWNYAGESWYNVAIRTGPTRHNATPFKNIRAYVETPDII